jgi:hypothetical protein
MAKRYPRLARGLGFPYVENTCRTMTLKFETRRIKDPFPDLFCPWPFLESEKAKHSPHVIFRQDVFNSFAKTERNSEVYRICS